MLFSDLIVCIFPAIDLSEKGNHIGKIFENFKNSGLDPGVQTPTNFSAINTVYFSRMTVYKCYFILFLAASAA